MTESNANEIVSLFQPSESHLALDLNPMGCKMFAEQSFGLRLRQAEDKRKGLATEAKSIVSALSAC